MIISASNIDFTKGWHKTKKKQHTVNICMPFIGTAVYSKPEKVTYVTNEKDRFIVRGEAGDFNTIDGQTIEALYQFMDGSSITPEKLGRYAIRNGDKVLMDWLKLKSIPDYREYHAYYIKPNIKDIIVTTILGGKMYVNIDEKGDYIVCSDLNGEPNLNNTWVESYLTFPYTYDMRAFKQLD